MAVGRRVKTACCHLSPYACNRSSLRVAGQPCGSKLAMALAIAGLRCRRMAGRTSVRTAEFPQTSPPRGTS
eukprot:2478898-Alexandrium_andersonii.AAC.1